MMNLKYRDEINKCRLKCIKHKLIIPLNVEETCTKIYDTFNSSLLLKVIKSIN